MLRLPSFPGAAPGAAQAPTGSTQAPTAADFPPARVVHVELRRPIPPLDPVDPGTGRRYERALVLARLHDRPLGLVTVDLSGGGLDPREHARILWAAVGERARAHLLDDGLSAPVSDLDAAGLPTTSEPRCIETRSALLHDAPLASVVVATRDHAESLEVCLDSLLALEYPALEIVVVDNAPTSDATADLVRRVSDTAPHVRYAREDRPGLAPSRKRGIQIARGEIVAITDDDVIVDRLWLAELVAGFGRAEDVAGVTGSVLPMEIETPTQALIEQYWGLGKGFDRRVYDLGRNRVDSPLYPYSAGIFGSGANLAFRASTLRELGGFDPCLGAGTKAKGGEELAIFFQILQRGERLVYEPAAIINHRHRADYEGLRRQTYGYGVGLTAYLMKILVDRPTLALDVARRVPRGAWFALSPTSKKNRAKGAAYPAELTRLELQGMLAGPFAYLASRWDGRHATRDVAHRDDAATATEPAREAAAL
jgi:GT2 family glycosyltransferase